METSREAVVDDEVDRCLLLRARCASKGEADPRADTSSSWFKRSGRRHVVCGGTRLATTAPSDQYPQRFVSRAVDSQSAPVADIVIVSYRCRELVRAALEALEEHKPYAPIQVCVVDNASHDGTAEMIRSDFPHVLVIDSGANVGFAVACNIGIRRGSGRYVLALNPDTRITPGALDKLLRFMDNHPEVGICGCRLINEKGVFEPAAKRAFPTVTGALGYFLGIARRKRAPKRLAQYTAPDVEGGPVDAVCGACMLMRRSALEEVGLFDEGYWMYQEDLDLCYRFHEAGWITWYEPSVTVMHFWGGSSGRSRSPRLNYAFHYGMYRFYRKHYARNRSPAVNLVVYLGILAKLVLSIGRSSVRRAAVRLRRHANHSSNVRAVAELKVPKQRG